MKNILLIRFVLIVILSGLVFGTYLAESIHANVYINEVFPNPSGETSEPTEFIELYNSGESEVDLSGYKLTEAKEFLIEDVVLAPGAYVALDRSVTSLALNNSGDSVTLVGSDGHVVDAFTFDKTTEDYSWSRYPDGIGEYYSSSVVTRGGPNVVPASPTLTPTPTPTATSTPTKQVNTPTVTNSPTKVPLKTPISTIEVRKFSPTPIEIDEEPTERNEDKGQVLSVVNEAEQNSLVADTPEKISKFGYAPLFIIAGGVFLAAAGLTYFKTKE